MSHTRRKFDSEFRAGAVRIVRETRRPVVEIARGVARQVLRTVATRRVRALAVPSRLTMRRCGPSRPLLGLRNAPSHWESPTMRLSHHKPIESRPLLGPEWPGEMA